MQKRFVLRAGSDLGRIYRVYPETRPPRPIPRLDQLGTAALVAAMESPNGWQRDTVQRLLVEKQDSAAIAPLRALLQQSPSPKTRLQALATRDGLGAIDSGTVMAALHDSHPAVREHAVRLSECFLRPGETACRRDPAVGNALLAMTRDPSIRVRYQLAFSLGEWN